MRDFEPFHWTCPHCRRDTIVSEHNFESGHEGFEVNSADGQAFLSWRRITCPSRDCKKSEFTALLRKAKSTGYSQGALQWQLGEPLGRGKVRFLPASSAEVFPDYVPEAIRQDYEEACLIVDLSPKAAATLARRALQGLVRDFWKAKGRTLKDEIDSVQDKCDPMVWDAMTAVRSVGNIGAHMERDIGFVIDVEPEEAQLLIGLIETLIRETYISRHRRGQQMQALVDLAAAKKQAKQLHPPQEEQPSATPSPRTLLG